MLKIGKYSTFLMGREWPDWESVGRLKNWSVSMRCFLSVDSSEKVKIKFPACSMLKLFTKNGNFITTSIISTKANNLTPPFDSYQKIMYKIK